MIPEEFRATISAAIDKELASSAADTKKRAIEAYYDRQLDTPAFAQKTLADISRLIDSEPRDSFTLVAAHHNILPQTVTRLAPYTELVNSGALRDLLISKARPIIYLHGHTHEDRLELLSGDGGGILLVISSPPLHQGFNNIRLTFTDEGFPLGCQIDTHRLTATGLIEITARRRFPMRDPSAPPLNDVAYNLLSKLLRYRSATWNEILTLASELEEQLADDELENLLLLLSFDNKLTIEHRDFTRKHWIVRAHK